MGSWVSDYHDVIARAGFEEQVAHALYKHIASLDKWTLADFLHLREGAVLRTFAPCAEQKLAHADFILEKCPYTTYPMDTPQEDRWRTHLLGYSKKTRSHIGYYERKLKAIYEYAEGFVRTDHDVDEALDALFELHRRRWNKRKLPGVLGGSRIQSFHRAAAKALLGRDWLRLHYIQLDGDYQALLYCFSFGSKTYYYQGGFEPDLSHLSLGFVLTARAMENSVGEGKEEFDFLRGDEPYKSRWTHGASRENLRRFVAHFASPVLSLAKSIHRTENAIEMRFKEYMHHVYSKEENHKSGGAGSAKLRQEE
jgi:CelD/BcsL family acetyltransferase involved in cellulose biosynthesis